MPPVGMAAGGERALSCPHGAKPPPHNGGKAEPLPTMRDPTAGQGARTGFHPVPGHGAGTGQYWARLAEHPSAMQYYDSVTRGPHVPSPRRAGDRGCGVTGLWGG